MTGPYTVCNAGAILPGIPWEKGGSMKHHWPIIAVTAAILLLAGCSLGLRNEALQSCLEKANLSCSETAGKRCKDKTGASKASCQKITREGCLAEAEKSCQQRHQRPVFENGNGGGGY